MSPPLARSSQPQGQEVGLSGLGHLVPTTEAVGSKSNRVPAEPGHGGRGVGSQTCQGGTGRPASWCGQSCSSNRVTSTGRPEPRACLSVRASLFHCLRHGSPLEATQHSPPPQPPRPGHSPRASRGPSPPQAELEPSMTSVPWPCSLSIWKATDLSQKLVMVWKSLNVLTPTAGMESPFWWLLARS